MTLDKKQCKYCGKIIRRTEFPKQFDRMITCGDQECKKTHFKIYQKEFMQSSNHKEKRDNYIKKWKEKNREKIRTYGRIYSQCEKCKKTKKAYIEKNKEHLKRHASEHYKKNKEIILLKRQKRYYGNLEYYRNKYKLYNKKYQQKPENKEKAKEKREQPENKQKMKQYQREHWKNNKFKLIPIRQQYRSENKGKCLELQRKWHKNKQKHDIKYRLTRSIYGLLWCGLKSRNIKKAQHWEEMLGYTIDDLKTHLEKQFKPGMTWDNYGPVWHIDHRIPQSWFKFTKSEDSDFKKCWALENLQPKWAEENIKKKAQYAEPTLNQILMEAQP